MELFGGNDTERTASLALPPPARLEPGTTRAGRLVWKLLPFRGKVLTWASTRSSWKPWPQRGPGRSHTPRREGSTARADPEAGGESRSARTRWQPAEGRETLSGGWAASSERSAILNSRGRAVFVCEVLSQVPGASPCPGQEEPRQPARSNLPPGHHVFRSQGAVSLGTGLNPAHVRALKTDSRRWLRGRRPGSRRTCCRRRNWEALLAHPPRRGEPLRAALPGPHPRSHPKSKGFLQVRLVDPRPHPDFTLEILKTLEKSHVGGWFPWGFLPSPDGLILWSVPDVCKDVDLDVLVDALKPVGTFKKIGKVFRREEDSTVGMLQIGEDVDCLLIPREVRLAGGVWRVISKPATKEAEFRERLAQFLEEEGRTLEDVARVIEKSTPHPPQPPQKPKEPRARRRVPQMVTPPPRLVVGTYDSSNASDSEFSDFEASRKQSDKGRRGPARGRKVRKMPVSYLGSKFLGSDLESEDDEELVEAFLRRGEKQPGAPARCRANLPVPMFEDGPGLRPSKGDRWRECVSQVSWGKLKRRVRGWAPRSGPRAGEAQQASVRVERDEGPCSDSQGDHVGSAGGGLVPEAPPRRWRPKIKWSSFRLLRREEAVSAAQGAEAVGDQRVEAAADQRVEAVGDQRVEAAAEQRVEAAADQGVEAAADQRVEAAADQGVEAAADQRAEAAGDQRVEVAADQRVEAAADQGVEAAADQRVEAVGNQRVEAATDQGAEAVGDQRVEAAADQRVEAVGDQRVEAAADQRAEAPVVQGAEAASDGVEARAGQRAEASAEAAALAAPGATGATPGAGARKQVKTVRFQTPGRFSWFRKRRRAFWHTPRLPTLPKSVPRAGEARGLRVLRAEARAEAEQEEQEDLL